MRRTKLASLALAAALALMLGGCGSNRDSGGDQSAGGPSFGTDPETGIAFVGAGTCINCHKDLSFSAEVVQGYLESKHVIHSTSINAASPASCLECHDPIGDGTTIQGLIDPAAVPSQGLAAIGCENCHGPGGQHYGTGPIPNFSPDFEVCGKCHKALPDNPGFHPAGLNVIDAYKQSGHALQNRTTTPCFRCHSDFGFRMYVDGTRLFDNDNLEKTLEAAPPVESAPIQCRTCHDQHKTGALRVAETTVTRDSAGTRFGTDAEGNSIRLKNFSSEFNLCTACHQAWLTYIWVPDTEFFNYTLFYDPANPDENDVPHHGDANDPRIDSRGRTIVDTHFKYLDPANSSIVLIEGYNINAASEHPCTQCHDQHAGTKFADAPLGLTAGTVRSLAEAWGSAEGFHGDYMGPAFEGHGCVPCHSPEGLIELSNTGEYPAEVSTDVAVIACIACHDLRARNAADDGYELGSRRTISNFAFDNARTLDPENPATIEGLGDNALCMTCHQGRESTASVNAKVAGPAPYSFSNIHYLAAAATLFGNQAKGAYEYDGKVYSSKFEHVESNDLCVECHNAHSGELYLYDSITNETSAPTTCDACHPEVVDTGDYETDHLAVRDIRMNGSYIDYDGDGDTDEGIFYEVETLQEILLGLVEDYAATVIGIPIEYNPDAYPYYFKLGTTDRYVDFDAKLLKAAYNLQVSLVDPGSYAHNGTYTIEYLYDSIEDLGGPDAVADLTRDAEGHFDAAGEPFRHWDEDGEVDAARCARCHSSDGAKAYIEKGSVTSADFAPYTKGISAGLACEVCHTAPIDTSAGTTRIVESVTFPSKVVLTATEAPDYFDNASPLCMNCHQGRSSSDSVDADIAKGDFSFENIHYFAAAASQFGSLVRGGYQYAGQDYAGPMVYPAAHDADGFFTCVGCHMSGDPEHDFTPDLDACIGCHGGTSFETLGDGVSDNFDDIQLLKDQLLEVITDSGVTPLPGYPYFSGITNAAQKRAAYNWQVADKEPCGYIHNPDYIKQLLYDSIDDLSGGTVTPVVDRP